MQKTSMFNVNADFKRMYYGALFRNGFLIVVYLKKNRLNETKLGITVSKKVGDAVVRNRVRRIILAAYRELIKERNLIGFSIVVVAKQPCSKVKMQNVLAELKKHVDFIMNRNLRNSHKFSNFRVGQFKHWLKNC